MNLQAAFEALRHLVGFGIVMVALTALWGLAELSGRIMAAVAPPAPPARPPAPLLPAEPGGEVPGEDLVVIAAAAAALLGSRGRVVSVHPVSSSWGQQGRRDIHASHRIR